jgi:hypothetical protein
MCLLFTGALAYGQDISSFIELLRSDVKTQKAALLTEALQFNEQESAVFWPIYREYDLELNKIGDARVEFIKEFAGNYLSLTDQKAKELADRWFKLQESRMSLMKKYYKKFEKALSPKAAARFTQIENQINLLIDLQIASSMPLVK